MLNVQKLIYNELIKLASKTGNWVMTALLPLLVLGAALLCRYAGADELDMPNVWVFMDLILSAIPNLMDIVTLFTIIVAAGIVASEFSGGTIKLLLIRPFHRSTLLFAKYAASLLYGLCLMVLLALSGFLIGGLLFGFDGGSAAHAGSSLTDAGYVWKALGCSAIELVVMVSLAFMFSTVFRSSAMAIGISLFFLLAGGQLAYVLKPFAWSKYLIFANSNLLLYLDGNPILAGMTLHFSLMALTIYLIGFLGLSWLVFAKRDVAG
ncbi:ABC transporter permease [Paenibacillus oryzisoli]|uniref:ABC transporter permease n=1 Tax=Paenibacillus oryzisoli TaxID=1850517 RepID=UPI003D2C1B24